MTQKTDYAALDAAIIEAIKHGDSPLYSPLVARLVSPIVNATGRNDLRVTDGRLQALRKAGIIEFDRTLNRWLEVTK